MKISYNEIKHGMFIRFSGTLYEVLSSEFIRMQKQKPVMRVKLKNATSGKVKEMAFQPSDSIDEVELSKLHTRFIYKNKEEYWFNEKDNPSNRFSFSKDQLGDKIKYLKKDIDIIAVVDDGNIIGINLPAKVDLLVESAPPSIKGNTSSGGTKLVTVETGAKISTPLFINDGDIIRTNTQTGEYSERVEKTKGI